MNTLLQALGCMLDWKTSSSPDPAEVARVSDGVVTQGRPLVAGGQPQALACFVRDGSELVAGGVGRTELKLQRFLVLAWVMAPSARKRRLRRVASRREGLLHRAVTSSRRHSLASTSCRRTMLHHVSLGVVDLQRSAAFYDAVLTALGYARVWADETAVGYGHAGGGDQLAIKLRPSRPVALASGFHLAFAAPSREAVARFHSQALQHGGSDNGPPGLRPEYGENYYAAFVVDPDGHRVEAVINAPA